MRSTTGAARVRIGELAKATGSTARALRHYEQAGLIRADRAGNGYRDYDERTATRVRNIRYLLDAGLTLDDVSAFAACLDGDLATATPSGRGRQIALDRLAVLDRRIARQLAARERLAAALGPAAPAPAQPAALLSDVEPPPAALGATA